MKSITLSHEVYIYKPQFHLPNTDENCLDYSSVAYSVKEAWHLYSVQESVVDVGVDGHCTKLKTCVVRFKAQKQLVSNGVRQVLTFHYLTDNLPLTLTNCFEQPKHYRTHDKLQKGQKHNE